MRKPWFFLTFVWLLLILLIQPQGEFPLNDDWQYAYAVKGLLEDGQLSYRGYFSPIVLIQVLWGYAFHLLLGQSFSFTVLRWSTLVLVPLGTYLIMKFGRSLGNESAFSDWFLGALFCTSPLLVALAPSFMSDVPFLVVALWSIWAYWRFHESGKTTLLAAALFLAFLAFYIRQPGLVLPLAFGLHHAWHGWSLTKSPPRLTLVWPVLLGLACSALFLLSWELGVKPGLQLDENFKSDAQNYLALLFSSPSSFFLTWALRMVKSFIYLSFFTLPLLPFFWRLTNFRSIWSKGSIRWLIIVISAGLVITAHWAGKPFPFGGNIFFNFGLGPELLADAYTLKLGHTPHLPQFILDILHFLAASWGLSLLYFVYNHYRRLARRQQSFLQCWIIVSGLYLSLMAITSYYDRYVLLPLALLLPFLISLLQSTRKFNLRAWPLFLPLFLFGLFSVVATHDYLAWNRARATAWHWLEEQNHSIQEVDAGYEWNGWLNYGETRIDAEDVPFWWVTDNRYILAFGPIAGYEEIHAVSYHRYLFAKKDAIRILHRIER